MTTYLASPNTQQQAEHCADMPVLLSYAICSPWMDRYQHSFSRILIDSGAFTELSNGKKIDVGAYDQWAGRWVNKPHVDAVAGLDDISGDWKRSMKNYQRMPYAFPTFHDTDPIELLPELIAMAKERAGWMGLGLLPPRQGSGNWLMQVGEQIPDDIHVHGWALREYQSYHRLNSVDSTNWWRDAMKINKDMKWLTYGECLDIIVKRYKREDRIFQLPTSQLSTKL